jgi:hypothetical protein
MSKEVIKAAAEAQGILSNLENGKTYYIEYVAKRFEKAAQDHSTDALVCYMRDILVKNAAKKEFITQKEIGQMYDQMYGLSGGHTSFRNVLGDLLPDNRQFAKIAHPGSQTRTMEEKNLEPAHQNSKLSSAYSVIFSLGNDSSFSTHSPQQNKLANRAVYTKLTSLGYIPTNVELINQNEHFALCLAHYTTQALNKAYLKIPVQISNGSIKDPEYLIDGQDTVPLNQKNIVVALKESENYLKKLSHKKLASGRGDGSNELQFNQVAVPKALEEFTSDLENTLVAAASKFNYNQVKLAISILDTELNSFGMRGSEIRVGSSDAKGIIFDTQILSELGKVAIQVPVEFHNGKPILPSKFATDATVNTKKVYDFDRAGFESFLQDVKPEGQPLKMARQSGELSKMSYSQLMDRMVDGVATKDYSISEDVLAVVQARFGIEQFKIALDSFTQLLKHSSVDGSRRKQLIKSAYEKGDLIQIPTSVELYSPKLHLTVSKIAFDEDGRMVPAYRSTKMENLVQDTAISNSKIFLT